MSRVSCHIAIVLFFCVQGPSTAFSAPTQTQALTGVLSVVWADPPQGSPAQSRPPVYILTDQQGKSSELSISERTLRSAGGIMALNGRQVAVTAREVPSEHMAENQAAFALPLEVSNIRLSLLAQTNGGYSAAVAAPAAVTGAQPWVSIMCKFADESAEPKPLSYFQNMFASTYPGLDHYWREVSHNSINVVGSRAVGWFNLPQPRSYYVYDRNGDGQADIDFDRATNDCTAVANAQIHFPNFVGINLMFNAELDGYAWGGGRYMTLDGVTQIWRITWEPPWGYGDIGVMYHEMGHGFGLPHSSGKYGQTYDNVWDVMSDHWSYCYVTDHPVYGCLGQHTIAYHKDMLGWIPAAQKLAPPYISPVTVKLERLSQPQTGDPRIIQIPIKGSDTHFYTVEARQFVGYDQMLPGEAVVIHEVDTTRERPAQLVDIDNNGSTDDEGAMWVVGETFTDVANGISVEVNASTANGFEVTIIAPIPEELRSRALLPAIYYFMMMD